MINVMTYDFHGSWDPMTGEVSPLFKGPEDHGGFIYFNVVSENRLAKYSKHGPNRMDELSCRTCTILKKMSAKQLICKVLLLN